MVGVAAWEQGLFALRGFSTPEESMTAIESSGTTESANAARLPKELGAGDAISEMLWMLFAGNPDVVIVAGSKRRIVAANPSAVTGLGYSRERREERSSGQRYRQRIRKNP